MSVVLFDPLTTDDSDWLESESVAKLYLQAIARVGVSSMISNVRTRLYAMKSEGRVFPVTENDGEVGDSYVCLPHSAYILYALEEMKFVDIGFTEPLMRFLIGAADRLLLKSGINKIVHLDNWLLSTNLHGDWKGHDLPAMRENLVAKFPDHILAVRSVDAWSCPDLLANGKADDWLLLPSRQIWVTQDMKAEWRPRNAIGNDRRLINNSPLMMENMSTLRAGDAERISELYHNLYVGKYSALNPIFTPRFIEMTHATGMLTYRGARDQNGQLQAVAGSFVRNGILTPPVVGYDTSRPKKEGLYRIACYLFSELAEMEGFKLNGSAGAPGFKALRGAKSEIEYTLFYVKHLPWQRRMIFNGLALLLNRVAVPLMKRLKL